ncbi:hypothetical protein CPC08DRAFT_699455 [Agrocybe pediades]|nr:hypothetical protein CPC08DRAFT_699455 [Agrocybe pediades]
MSDPYIDPRLAPLTLTTGPRLIGVLLHYGLFGALTVQVYLYHLVFPQDPIKNKMIVYSVYALELAQTAMITDYNFHIFGSGYGDPSQLNKIGLYWLTVPIISGIVAFVGQMFYSYRISVLSGSYFASTAVMLLALVQLVASIAEGVVLKNAGLYSQIVGRAYAIPAGIWPGSAALCDISIVIFMTFYLWKRGSGIAMPKTQVLLRRIVTLVIETGMVTATVDVVILLLSTIPTKGPFYLVSVNIIGKLYSNCMLVILNSRMKLSIADPPSYRNDIEFAAATASSSQLTRARLISGQTAESNRSGIESEMRGGAEVTREPVALPGVTQARTKQSYTRGTKRQV